MHVFPTFGHFDLVVIMGVSLRILQRGGGGTTTRI